MTSFNAASSFPFLTHNLLMHLLGVGDHSHPASKKSSKQMIGSKVHSSSKFFFLSQRYSGTLRRLLFSRFHRAGSHQRFPAFLFFSLFEHIGLFLLDIRKQDDGSNKGTMERGESAGKNTVIR